MMGKTSRGVENFLTKKKLLILIVLALQLLLLFHLNVFNNDNQATIQSLQRRVASLEEKSTLDDNIIHRLDSVVVSLKSQIGTNQVHMKVQKDNYLSRNSSSNLQKARPDGIALLLMTDQPKWFQRRYALLVQNLLSNLPTNWIVQIFHPDSKQYHAGIALNPGFKRLIDNNHPRLHMTKLPLKLVKARKRPIHLMLHPFIWENTLAEKVLYLDGNHVLCANSPFNIQNFVEYDYIIGAPGWGMFKGIHLYDLI